MYDLIVIGGGPAGLTAALYARRANKTVLVIEKGSFGGQITYSPKVENIPGFTEITGNEFGEKMVEQVLAQEAEVECAEVLEVKDGVYKTVVTDSGEFTAKSLVIATGAKHRLLGLPGEEKYIGEGISFCAVCDGAFYEGKEVAVIGGGNSALQEAILLADLAKKVTVVQNLDFLTGEKKLQDKLATKPNVEVILGTVVDGFIGGDALEGIRIRKESDGTVSDVSEKAELTDSDEKRKCRKPEEIVSIAKAALGQNGYNILHNNCEHFVYSCVFGEKRSFLDEAREAIRKKLNKG